MEPAELGVRIAHRIAAHKGCDAATLDPPVHEVVNVDALETLIRSHPHERTDFTGSVSFDYQEYSVTVDHTGTVSVTQATAAADRADSDDATDRRIVCET